MVLKSSKKSRQSTPTKKSQQSSPAKNSPNASVPSPDTNNSEPSCKEIFAELLKRAELLENKVLELESTLEVSNQVRSPQK